MVVLAVLLAGCASVQPNPAQERAYTAAAECNRITGYSYNVFVNPDGRLRVGEGRLDGLSVWKTCMRERFGYRWAGD